MSCRIEVRRVANCYTPLTFTFNFTPETKLVNDSESPSVSGGPVTVLSVASAVASSAHMGVRT